MNRQQLTGLLFYGEPDPQWPELPPQPHGCEWLDTLRAPTPDGRQRWEWLTAACIFIGGIGYVVLAAVL